MKPRNNFGWKKGSSGSVTSFFSRRGCFAAKANEGTKEGWGIGVKSNFLEDPKVVGGVKGVRMLREEASFDGPEGVFGESQRKSALARDDAVETVDAGDNHDRFLESSQENRLSCPSSFGVDCDKKLLHGWRSAILLRGVMYLLWSIR